MLLENTTDENIYVFTGIFVPGRGSLSIDATSFERVKNDALIADYLKAGALHLNTGTEPQVSVDLPAPVVSTPDLTAKDAKVK